jgi:site-specific DNA recombinase
MPGASEQGPRRLGAPGAPPRNRSGHRAPGACGAGQRSRFHRRPAAHRAARPGRTGGASVPAGGLLACGQCGRRLESAWSNGKPAYRCRHGYTSATSPDPARPRNTHVREDQILPHLAAIAILRAGPPAKPAHGNRSPAQVTGPVGTAALIDQLRADGVVLTYDPQDRTLRAHGHDKLAVTRGKDR